MKGSSQVVGVIGAAFASELMSMLLAKGIFSADDADEVVKRTVSAIKARKSDTGGEAVRLFKEHVDPIVAKYRGG